MAKTQCINGHRLWNGDGKPVVWVYRINYFYEFMEKYPDCIIDPNHDVNYFWSISDCVEGVPGEDLDCWYCDDCGSLIVYLDHYRYDYLPSKDIQDKLIPGFEKWEKYIALRDEESDDFDNFSIGKNPLSAIESYPFKYYYLLSADMKNIYAIDQENKVKFGFIMTRFVELPS